MKRISFALLAACLTLTGASLLAGCERRAPSPRTDEDGLQVILPVDQVRVGMRGYGMTVFHGATIEPFPVEVISVEHNSSPGRSAVWIRCPDARMQQSGPVAGMSGSPIYLWSDGETRQLGEGGKLIGAFAWGFSLSKDCYAGVQPIQYMRDAAARAAKQDDNPDEPKAEARAPGGAAMLGTLLKQADTQGVSETIAWQARAIERLLRDKDQDGQPLPAAALPTAPAHIPGSVQPLLLPVNIGSPQLAQMLQPLLAPSGLLPVAAPPGVQVSSPPPDVDVHAITFQPGSVLAEPLAWGDIDLSASGTVTDVLPDGTVLAFGHADSSMTQGKMVAPMATGFVHMVMPMVTTSFKYGGSAIIKGALIRNEQAGIVGSPTATFGTSPVKVSVNMPTQPTRDYNYHVIHNEQLTPILAAVVTLRSLSAVQAPPIENTMRVKSTIKFKGDYQLHVDKLMPGGEDFSIVMATLPALTAMSTNSFDPLMLESMETSIEVENGLRSATFVEGRLDRAEVAPGGTVGITITLQPYKKPRVEHRLELTIPSDVPDGDYPLFVSDASTYLQTMTAARPHLLTAGNIDELYTALKRILALRDDALYVSLQLQQHGLAIGQQELPRLPSSQLAMIASPVSTLAKPYLDTVETVTPIDVVPTGSVRFMIKVDSTLKP